MEVFEQKSCVQIDHIVNLKKMYLIWAVVLNRKDASETLRELFQNMSSWPHPRISKSESLRL